MPARRAAAQRVAAAASLVDAHRVAVVTTGVMRARPARLAAPGGALVAGRDRVQHKLLHRGTGARGRVCRVTRMPRGSAGQSRRAAEGSRGAAAGFVKVRKTGIWHKHRRIAASEAALVALVSLYAPWIQPGHTHAAQTVRLPMAPEHQTLLDGTRAVLNLRELSRKGGEAPPGRRAFRSQDGGERADDPPVAPSAAQTRPHAPAPADRELADVDFARAPGDSCAGEGLSRAYAASAAPSAPDSSNACQLLAVADRHSDFNPCLLLSLARSLPTPNETGKHHALPLQLDACAHAPCEHGACQPALGCISGEQWGSDAASLQSQTAPWGGAEGFGGDADGADEAPGSVLGRAASKTRPNYERRRSPHDPFKFNFNLVFNSVVLASNALFMLACSWRRWQVSLARCLVGLVVTNMLCPGLVVVFDSLPAELGDYFLMVALESLFWVT